MLKIVDIAYLIYDINIFYHGSSDILLKDLINRNFNLVENFNI
jgi:ABC-type lipopolysaccharide export system ATPase subunit